MVAPEDDAPQLAPLADAGAAHGTLTEPDVGFAPVPDLPPPLLPCVALVERACELLGVFSEECAEARARGPGKRTLEAQEICATELEAWEEGEGKASSTLACWRVAKARCKIYGTKSRICTESKAVWKTLRKRAQRKACQGDILILQAHEALPPKR